MKNLKKGDYIYDITHQGSEYRINIYEVIGIKDNYIYCRRQDGQAGKFRVDEPSIFSSFIEAKIHLYSYQDTEISVKDKVIQNNPNRNDNSYAFQKLKKAYYDSLNRKRNRTWASIHPIRKKRHRKISERIQRYEFNLGGEKNKKVVPYRPPRDGDWRFDSPKLKSDEPKLRPSVPYKVLPNGAIVSVHDDE